MAPLPQQPPALLLHPPLVCTALSYKSMSSLPQPQSVGLSGIGMRLDVRLFPSARIPEDWLDAKWWYPRSPTKIDRMVKGKGVHFMV